MKPSASAVLAVVLLVSLGGKLLVNAAPPGPTSVSFDTAATAMLANAGFSTVLEPRRFGTLLHGSRGSCSFIVADYDPHGTFDRLLHELAAPIGPLRFAWHGGVRTQVPKTAALMRFYLWRELRRVGISAAREPVAAWAASPGCDTSTIEWRRIARLAD